MPGMAAIARTSTNLRDLDEAAVQGLIRQLVGDGDWVGVIRLVERLAEHGPLGQETRLAEARAFLELRLMDRAWVRLREATDADSEDVAALLLTARMFIERGWPARARKVLDRVRLIDESNAELASLDDRAAEPPVQPPGDARDIEHNGDPARVLGLAERYAATGSVLRARNLLERLDRAEPGNPRVQQLLWGIRGEFLHRGQSLDELVRELVPAGDPGEWAEPDNTENVRLADIASADPETAEVHKSAVDTSGRGRVAFPSLFRRPSGPPERAPRGENDEVTLSAVLASPDELLDAPPETMTDPGIGPSEDRGDTQIMEVISSGGAPTLVPRSGRIHKPREEEESGPANLKRTLDLRAWQESMGVAAEVETTSEAPTGDTEGDALLEDEDHDIVVMRRREEPAEAPIPAAPRRGPIEVIERHPVPEVAPEPEPVPPPPETAPRPTPVAADSAQRTAAQIARWGFRMLVALGLLALLMVGLGILSVEYLKGVAADNVVRDVHRALAAGDWRMLQTLEAGLDDQVRDGVPPVGVRASELALVEAVLWYEFTGDLRRRQRALEALEIAEDEAGVAEEMALARALLALGEGDLAGADEQLGLVTSGDGEWRYLAARVALAQGQADTALAAWGGPGAPVQGVRHAVLVPELLTAAGREDEALARGMALFESASDNPAVFVAAHEHGWVDGDAETRLRDLDSFLAERRGSLPSRIVGRIHATRATLHDRLGRLDEARAARRLAHSSDPTWPAWIHSVASSDVADNRVVEAEKRYGRCLDLARLSGLCQRGAVQALLDLDRVGRARSLVDGWREARSEVAALDAWVALAEGRTTEAKNVASALLKAEGTGRASEEGIAWYVVGVVIGLEGADSERADRALERAARLLASTGDPLDTVLSVRVEAAQVEYGISARAPARVREVLGHGRADPIVEVHVGRYYENAGQEAAAAQHLDRAAAIGPENAVALYERGLFYYDPRRNISWAVESWRRYLDLGPSGPRADRVRQSPGMQ